MEVKLISSTGNPDRVCAAAAFTSCKKLSTAELFEELDDERAENLLRRVMGFGHASVMEHANFTFSIKGISRACSHQLIRHRVASYTQQSQRYVKFRRDEVDSVIPESIEKSRFREEFHEMMDEIAGFYERLLEEVPAEDARYILPNAAGTNLVVTMNARELNHFFGLRLCERSQWEIRELAQEMLDEARRAAPVLFEKAGPRCIQLGYCPEGKLGCGKMPTKEEVFKVR